MNDPTNKQILTEGYRPIENAVGVLKQNAPSVRAAPPPKGGSAVKAPSK